MPKSDANPISDLNMSDDMKKGYTGEMNWKKLEYQIIFKNWKNRIFNLEFYIFKNYFKEL